MPAPASPRRPSLAYRIAWWLSATGALAGPVLLISKVGFDETWSAFNRYTQALLEFSGRRPIEVPSAGGGAANFTRLDADLIAWHTDMSVLHARIGSMAVVGKVDADGGLDFEFGSASLKGARKAGFLPQRDLSMYAYLLLSAAAHFLDSVPLALVVLNLQLFCLAICLRLKGVNDALDQALGQLHDAQQAFLLLPLERGLTELVQQQACLSKLATLIHEWDGQSFGMAVALPHTSTTLAISINVLASLTLATMLRCVQVVAHGFYPRLPLFGLRGLVRKALAGGAEGGGQGAASWRRTSSRKLE